MAKRKRLLFTSCFKNLKCNPCPSYFCSFHISCFFFHSQWHHSLEIVDISSNSGVSDTSMELLSNFGMPKLCSLDLGSTNVTAEGVR